MNALGTWLGTLAEDVRFGCRMIGRSPIVSTAVVLTLGLGIGIAAGVFSLLNPIAFDPPVKDHPESFVSVSTRRNDFTFEEYMSYRSQLRSVRELAAWATLTSNGPGDSASFSSTMVSCNFFSVFSGGTPLLGRLIEPDDCLSPNPVMVLSDKLWRDRFAADPAIVGKTIPYLKQSITIVGVLSSDQVVRDSALYSLQLPMRALVTMPTFSGRITSGGISWLHLGGRLQPGYSRKEATAEIRLLEMQQLGDGVASPKAFRRTEATIALTNGSVWANERDFRTTFLLTLILPTLLMLLASANVATMLLSRAASRQREMAIRLALGTSRLRLIRMLFVETVLLSGIATLGSLVLIYKFPAVFGRFIQQIPGIPPLPDSVTPDWRVFAYLGVCTLLTAVCSGLAPALESFNLRLADSLKGRQFSGRRRSAAWMRNILVGAQVTLSMAPLVVLATTLQAERRINAPGFETNQVAIVTPEKWKDSETITSMLTRIESVPGVMSVAYSWDYPGIPLNTTGLDSAGSSPEVPYTQVSPAYFRTLGIPLVAGRNFEDNSGELHHVIVSQQIAQRLFPNSDPLGKTIETHYDGASEIIGVVRNIATFESAGPGDGSLVYGMLERSFPAAILVRFDGDLNRLAPFIQSVVQDTTGSAATLTSVRAQIQEEMKPVHQVEIVLLVLGVISLMLAVIGVFGVVSFSANQRRKEVAIRMALGAGGRDILRTILLAGLRPIPIGIVAGALLSWGGLKLATQILPIAVDAADPIPYIAVAVLLLGAAFAAMLGPARRAAVSDPVNALREE